MALINSKNKIRLMQAAHTYFLFDLLAFHRELHSQKKINNKIKRFSLIYCMIFHSYSFEWAVVHFPFELEGYFQPGNL